MTTIETTVGTCGVCEREIAVQDSKLVHHGYRRPGIGYIVGDCFAVGYEPYERSTAASVAYQAMVLREIPRLEARVAALESGRVTHFQVSFVESRHPPKYGTVDYAVGVTAPQRWGDMLRARTSEARAELSSAQFEVARMQRLIDGFELRELGTETRAGQKTREEKEARDAEKAAKRAVKAEKQAVLDAKNAARAEKLAKMSAELVDGLETLVAKAEACDAVAAPETRWEAEALVERVAKACRKTPKVTIHVMDLQRPELFLRVGLADKPHGHEWVNYKVWEVGGRS